MEYEIKRDNETIVLNEEEAREIYLLKESEYIKEDIRYFLREENSGTINTLSEDDIDFCVERFLRIRDICDPYYDAYWMCIEAAIEGEIKEKI